LGRCAGSLTANHAVEAGAFFAKATNLLTADRIDAVLRRKLVEIYKIL